MPSPRSPRTSLSCTTARSSPAGPPHRYSPMSGWSRPTWGHATEGRRHERAEGRHERAERANRLAQCVGASSRRAAKRSADMSFVVENLNAGYGPVEVLDDVSLQVGRGEIVALI